MHWLSIIKKKLVFQLFAKTEKLHGLLLNISNNSDQINFLTKDKSKRKIIFLKT
jgi:hypothetical protein